MKNFLFLFVAVVTLSAFSQTNEDVLYEYVNNKKHIVHTAQVGNTLWGLHTTYKVPVDSIISANPSLKNGIQEGVSYLIPIGPAETIFPNGTQILEHTILKGETQFSITKKYIVTTDDLVKYNPTLTSELKLGQVLRIPVKKNEDGNILVNDSQLQTGSLDNKTNASKSTVIFSDSLIQYTVLPGETLYTISKRFMVPVADLIKINNLSNNKIKPNDSLKIPLKKEEIKPVEIRQVEPIKELPKVDETLLFKKKEKYEIAVLLPFDLDSKGKNSLKTVATEFYMGVELAVDSLKNLGYNATVKIIDFPVDSIEIVAELKKATYKSIDLIFGPLLPQNVDIVSSWCKKNNVRMVCPSAINTNVLNANPFVYAAVSSDITQQRILARYALREYADHQIVLVNSGYAKDKDIYDAFRNRFLELSKTYGSQKLIEVKMSDFTTFIRKNGNTLLVMPTRDKTLATKFMNQLYKANGKSTTSTVSVFGTKEWANFDEISAYLKNKYTVQWATSSDLNYTLPETMQVLRLYRTKYKADMNKVAVQGFDVFLYFTQFLLWNETTDNLVANDFKMKSFVEGSGFENSKCFVIKHENYQINRVGSFNE
jgi:LysM repeat protein